MNTTLARHIAQRWAGTPDLAIFDDGKRLLTRAAFLDLAAGRQRQFDGRVRPGDMVMIQAGRGIQFFIDLFAVWASGGVGVPVAAEAAPAHVAYIAGVVRPVLHLGAAGPEGVAVIGETPAPAEGGPTFAEGDGASTAAILFTSGSTGAPKGVVLSHRVLAGNCEGILSVLGMHRDRLFINIPFGFTSAICHFLACALSESTLLGFETKFLLGDLPRKIAALGATGFGGAPVQLRWIAEACAARAGEGGLGLRFVISSGDHFSADIIRSFLEHAPNLKIFTVYGLTELGGRYCVLDPGELPARLGSVGKPIPGLTVSVRDADSGEPLGPGQEGEVVAGGSLLCDGYYRDPEKTGRLLRDYGLCTGDIGMLDEDGFLFLRGRKDDVFKVSGQKVSATVIADALMGLGLFRDVAVIAAPSPFMDNVPVAFCVMAPGVEFAKGQVLSLLRKVLPNNHLPDRFVLVDAIPRTDSGKAKRHELRAML